MADPLVLLAIDLSWELGRADTLNSSEAMCLSLKCREVAQGLLDMAASLESTSKAKAQGEVIFKAQGRTGTQVLS